VCNRLHTEKAKRRKIRGDPEKKEGEKMVRFLIDEEYRNMLPQAIAGARREIRIMMYRIQRKLGKGMTEENLFLDAIKDKIRRGVKVWLIIDYYPRPGMAYKENLYTALIMMDHGMYARYLKNSRVCHAKAVMIDKEIAIVGSHNWTTNSLKRNLEVSIMVKDKEEVSRLVEEFDKLYKEGVNF